MNCSSVELSMVGQVLFVHYHFHPLNFKFHFVFNAIKVTTRTQILETNVVIYVPIFFCSPIGPQNTLKADERRDKSNMQARLGELIRISRILHKAQTAIENFFLFICNINTLGGIRQNQSVYGNKFLHFYFIILYVMSRFFVSAFDSNNKIIPSASKIT